MAEDASGREPGRELHARVRVHWRRCLRHPLKTALAAAGAFLAYHALHMNHGYWAVITTIIVMQSNLGKSLQASSQRLIGTAIGAAVGAGVFWAGGSNFASLFVAVALTLWICLVAGLRESMRLAGVTVAIVMLMGGEPPLTAGVNRFLDVALGVVIAVFVSLAWPSRAHHELRGSLAQTYVELQELFSAVIACGLHRETDPHAVELQKAAVTARALRNTRLLEDAAREPGTEEYALRSLKESTERIRDHIYGIDYAVRPMAGDTCFHPLEPHLRKLFFSIRQAFEKITAELSGQATTSTPALMENLAGLEDEFMKIRQSGTTLQYGSDELLRFYSLVYRLRQLAQELCFHADLGGGREEAED